MDTEHSVVKHETPSDSMAAHHEQVRQDTCAVTLVLQLVCLLTIEGQKASVIYWTQVLKV